MNKKLPHLISFVFLAGCATDPTTAPLSAGHPANPEANEAVTATARPVLGIDATTRMTRQQFAVNHSERQNSATSHSDMSSMNSSMPGMSHNAKSGGMENAKSADVYTCTMHPEVKMEKPGNCPICGMKLVKKTPEMKP